MLYKILSRKKLSRNKYGDVDSSYKASSPSVFTPYTTGANSTPPTPQDDPVNFQLTKPTGMFKVGQTNYDTTYLVAMQGNALVPTYVYSVEESDPRLSTVIRNNGTTYAYIYMVGSSSMTDDGNVLITSYFEAPTYDEATYTYTYTGPVGQVYYNYHMGSAGQDGLNNAVVHIYKRAASQPATPTSSITTVYHFSTMVLDNPPTGWSTEIPANDGNPCWVSAASASSTHDAVILSGNIWASPVNVFADGEDGQDGIDGINTATINLYKKSAAGTTPSKPTGTMIYTFGTGGLTPSEGASLNGWKQAIEELDPTDTNPIWTTQAVAISRQATDTILAGEWGTPRILSQNGERGLQGAAVRGPVRWIDNEISRRFCAGADGDDPEDGQFIDVVVRVNSSNVKEYYKCIESFTATTSDTWDDVSSHFALADNVYDFIAADLLLAENGKVKFFTTNEFNLSYMTGNTEVVTGGMRGADPDSDDTIIWAGAGNPSQGAFRVTQSGAVYANNAYITGEIHALSGTFDGYIQTTLTPVNTSITITDKLNLNCDLGGFYNQTITLPSDASFIGKRVIITNNNFPPYTQTTIGYHTRISVDAAAISAYRGIGGNIDIDNSGSAMPANIKAFSFRGGVVELLGIPNGTGANATRWVLLSGHRSIVSYETM